jgi:hypothetical protein
MIIDGYSIDGYFINGYWWLFGAYSINDYWVAILLMAIWWLFY